MKENLNFNYMVLCEGFSYCKCEILWLLSCIAQTLAKIKTRIAYEIFETKYIDTSFQVVNRTEI